MNLGILGATGSIGKSAIQAVDLLRAQGEKIELVLLSANKNVPALLDIASRYEVKNILVTAPDADLSAVPNSIRVLHDVVEYKDFISQQRIDRMLIAMVGAAALEYVVATLEAGIDVALANKESLVIAGEIIKRVAAVNHARILPVDSEHSALFQCLETRTPAEVASIVLTASGGPFYDRNMDQLAAVKYAEAVEHPVWKMGKKISVDSATLMNKALEIIEAHYLFGEYSENIEVLIHPQSIIHGLVRLVDGAVLAHMAVPDMKLPIAYAITYPKRLKSIVKPLDLVKLQKLTFLPVDTERFPAINLAYSALEKGGGATAVLNAANEECVELYSKNVIGFLDISSLVKKAVDSWQARSVSSIEDVIKADKWAREFIRKEVGLL